MKTFVLLALLCLAVTSQAFAGSATIPSRALAVTQIQKLTNWEDTFDTGTGTGSSTGLMRVESSPSRSGASREFVTAFTNSGGERYWVTFGEDTSSSNFVYDGWFYVAKPSSGIANIEMDLNQVMSNGQTVIYGFQCDGYSGTWDYTENSGTPQVPIDKWLLSTKACTPQKYPKETWHNK